MIERILNGLKKAGVGVYKINETVTASVECFFIRKRLDLKRCTDLTEYGVTVYHPFEKDGQQMLGSSEVQIYPEMEDEELEEALLNAYHGASFICNPYYELYKGETSERIMSDSGFAGHTLEKNMKIMSEALFAADTSDTVFINSAEVFARRQIHHIMTSAGADVRYETCTVEGEYVVQCTTPQDVETYHQFMYREPDTQSLKAEVGEALKMTRARAEAVKAPKAGEYTVLLSGRHVRTLLSYYLSRSGSGMIYQQYSNYQVGMPVQGEHIQGDALTIWLKAREPFSPEGIPMKDRILIKNGSLETIHGSSRFAYYLGIEPTGEYGSIFVPVGNTPVSEMTAEKCLHIISFSDFQMDDFSGHFGGEIRLALLYENGRVTPVTGGSVNGSIMKVQDDMVFSKERYKNGNYEGPYAVALKGVRVAGQ